MRKELEIQPIDTRIIVAFRLYLKTAGLAEKTVFDSDDLHDFVAATPIAEFKKHFEDPHTFGAFIAKLKGNNIAFQVDEKPSRIKSNHSRKIDVLQWRY